MSPNKQIFNFLSYSIIIGIVVGSLASIGDIYLWLLYGIISLNTYLAIIIGYLLFCVLISLLSYLIILVTVQEEKRRIIFRKFYFFIMLYLIEFVYVNGKLNGWFNFTSLRAILLNSLLIIGVLFLYFIVRKNERFGKLFSDEIEYLKSVFLIFTALAFFNYFILNWSSPLKNKIHVIALQIILLAIPVLILYAISILNKLFSFLVKSERVRKLVSGLVFVLIMILMPVVFKDAVLTFYKIANYQIDDGTLENLKGKPNIIWIVLDTVRKDHLSCYGYERPTTPNLEGISKESMVFTNYISTAPWTLPSHASMLTGLYSTEHGAHLVDKDYLVNSLEDRNLTIAEILKDQGYNTAAFISNFGTINREHNFAQGFNFFYDGKSVFYSSFWGLLTFNVKFLQNLKDEPIFRINKFRLSPEINKTILRWLRRNGKVPFFLFINYMEAHSGTNFLPDPFGSMYGFSWEKWLNRGKETKSKKQKIEFDWYDCKITYLDHHLGQLFKKLKELDLYDNAIIIIVSDHGQLFGEHGSYGHITDLYNELIDVPLLIKYPAYLDKKGVENKYVQTVDIMPEILSLLDIPLPESISGQPFCEVNHQIVAELFKNKKIARKNLKRYYRDLKAIFSHTSPVFKYFKSSNGDDELYNLSNDPHEQNNIIHSEKEKAQDLEDQLFEWFNSIKKWKKSGNKNKKITKELKNNLKALGYIK